MAEAHQARGPCDIRVTLLGTSVPTPVLDRFSPSPLVEAGGETLLFDAGRGVLQRLFQLQTPLKALRTVFLTHLHSDHVVGLPDLWLTGWLVGQPEVPLRVWGPRGTTAMMAHLDQAFQFDIRIRLYDDRPPPQGIVVVTEEITEGVVYEHNGVTVTAFAVAHHPIQWPSGIASTMPGVLWYSLAIRAFRTISSGAPGGWMCWCTKSLWPICSGRSSGRTRSRPSGLLRITHDRGTGGRGVRPRATQAGGLYAHYPGHRHR